MHTTIAVRAAALALAAGLAAASPAAAQESPLHRGASSIMVSVSPEVEVGYWGMLSERTALGLVGAAQRFSSSVDESESSQTELVLAPQVKRYVSVGGAVLPYLHASVFGSLFDLERGDDSSTGSNVLGGTLGAGLDWFPTARFSLGGHAGLALSRTGLEAASPGGQESEATLWSLQTFTAAIRVHLYL